MAVLCNKVFVIVSLYYIAALGLTHTLIDLTALRVTAGLKTSK